MGMTYVCSDVHSHAGVLREALEVLEADDCLYMIGDIADKGPDGLEALKILMDDPRCDMILGNHDMMFLQNYACFEHADEIPEALPAEIFVRWQVRNFGFDTWQAFMNETVEEQQRMIGYLRSRPILKTVEVDGRKFCLVHAAVPHVGKEIRDLYLDAVRDETYPFLYDWKNDYVWGRYVTRIPGYTVIVGHTAAQYYHDEYVRCEDDVWYDIDCGLAYNFPSSKLALMCLNDMEIRYFPIFKD